MHFRAERSEQETDRANAQISFNLPICPAAGNTPCVIPQIDSMDRSYQISPESRQMNIAQVFL